MPDDHESLRTIRIAGQTFSEREVTVAAVAGRALFEGDIDLGPIEPDPGPTRGMTTPQAILEGHQMPGIGLRWPDATLPYVIDPELPHAERVRAAIRHWQARSVVQFRKRRPSERNVVRFAPGPRGTARVGMTGGEQRIAVADADTTGDVIHRIGHTVGLWHTHSRPDREHFVTVGAANLRPDRRHWFIEHVADGDDGGRYDHGSVMHLGAYAGADDPGQPTLWAPVPIGQRLSLSHGDAAAVARIYGLVRPWHTHRHPDGRWAGFDDLEHETGGAGVYTDSRATVLAGELHVCMDSRLGLLWHTVRRGDGAWSGLEDVEHETGDPGAFARLDCAGVGGELHLCGVTGAGRLWHAHRRTDGVWSSFEDVEQEAGERGFVVAVAACGLGHELHLSGVAADGQLWHAQRLADGAWTAIVDVAEHAAGPGRFVDLQSAAVGRELHVIGVTGDGRLWHTLRHHDGAWVGFADIDGGPGGAFAHVGCAGIGEQLHVCAINAEGRLLHAVRHPDGAWSGFTDVHEKGGGRGMFLQVDCAALGDQLHVVGIAATR